jgi:hypothetical protein
VNAATVGGRRRVVTLLVDVRTLAHNAIAQTWRPIPPTDATPETEPAEWARLLAVTGNIRRHLDDLEELAHAALEELGYELELVSTGATLQPSTSTGAPA